MPIARDEAGNLWEVDAQGNPVRALPGAQGNEGRVLTAPTSPQQQRQNDRQDRNDGRVATNDAARIQLERERLIEQKRQFDATHQPDGTPKQRNTQLSPEVRSKALAQWNAAQELDRIIADMRVKYSQGPGSTRGVAGLRDFFPGEANERFDKAGSQARGIVRNAIGLTGGEANTAAEAAMNLGGYIPEASNFDGTNEDIFANLQGVRDNAARQAIQTLGGIPDANGNITPVEPRNAMTETRLMEGGDSGAAGYGATSARVDIPRPMQDEFNTFLAQSAGRASPQEYARFRAELDRKYGFGAPDAAKLQSYIDEGSRYSDAVKRGGTINTRIPGPERPMSLLEQGRNNLVDNPVGGAAAGFANMMGIGGAEYFAPDHYQALRDSQGAPVMIGEMVGAAYGTGKLGHIGRTGAERLAPKLLADTARGRVLRNLATDMTFSGAYGGVTEGDPLTSSLAGGVGSIAGQGVAKVSGAAIGGAMQSPTAQYLRSLDIPLTVGQTFGGALKSLEDGATSLPIVGDMINARRLEGLRALNKAALARAGEPVQAVTSNLGEQGANDLLSQIGDAYDNATTGVRVPLDARFAEDISLARQAGANLPPDLSAKFDLAMTNRIDPVTSTGEITGDAYQQAHRGLKSYKAEATKPGFEADYRDALSMGQDALRGAMERGGGASAAEGLSRADIAYRRLKTLQKAQAAAKNGSMSGEVQVFTPAQLNAADYASSAKFGGKRQFGEMADAAQTALPDKIPDSGTAKRLMQNVVGAGALGGGAAGYGYATGDTDGLKRAATAAALLTLGGTRAGQKAITAALTKRPKAAQRLGELVRKQQRRFGAAAIPLAIESTR